MFVEARQNYVIMQPLDFETSIPWHNFKVSFDFVKTWFVNDYGVCYCGWPHENCFAEKSILMHFNVESKCLSVSPGQLLLFIDPGAMKLENMISYHHWETSHRCSVSGDGYFQFMCVSVWFAFCRLSKAKSPMFYRANQVKLKLKMYWIIGVWLTTYLLIQYCN